MARSGEKRWQWRMLVLDILMAIADGVLGNQPATHVLRNRVRDFQRDLDKGE